MQNAHLEENLGKKWKNESKPKYFHIENNVIY